MKKPKDKVKKQPKKKYTLDDHLGCPSYPNCDLSWTGCRIACDNAKIEVEYFGHKG